MGPIQKIAILLAFIAIPYAAAQAEGLSALGGHVPHHAISKSLHLGRVASADKIQMAVSLNLRNPDQLGSLLKKLYDPKDPEFHHFLSDADILENFSPSSDDIGQVKTFLASKGLTITKVHPNNLVIDVEGPVAQVENAFQIELHEYITPDGRIAYGPTSDPVVNDNVSPKISSIVGLNSFAKWKTHLKKNNIDLSHLVNPHTSLSSYMTPAKIKTGYGISGITQTGAGEVIALFELDGYTASDVNFYAGYFSLPVPNLQNVSVDGASYSTPGGGQTEVTLDIELAVALAPGASKIKVFEGPNTSTGVIDTYSAIEADNTVNEASSSWGEAENQMASADLNSENNIFTLMSAKGQSMFAAAGDNGAYDDSVDGMNSTLEVDDPGSQPYVTSVGGTLVTLTSSNTFQSETSWTTSASTGTYGQSNYTTTEGGGGGISIIWPRPSYQPASLATMANKGSTTMRMVPDVSLEADPANGYPIYVSGGWTVVGGTSCAAPLWAAYTALVNQKLVSIGSSRIGFANPALYAAGAASTYATSFHDIQDGSTNLYYPATVGYDLTTGWGSFNSGLFNVLTSANIAPYAPTAVTVTPGQLSLVISWTASTVTATYTLSRSTTLTGTYSTVATGLSATTYTDTGLTSNTTYFYKLTATNTVGTSSATAAVSGTTFPLPPTAPASLTATEAQ